MESDLNTKIQYLKGVGPKLAEKMHRLGIETVGDLIFCWPRTYLDYTNISKIADIESKFSNLDFRMNEEGKIKNANILISKIYNLDSNYFTLKGKIIGIANKYTSRQHMKVTEAVVEDGTGIIKLIWFNQPFLTKLIRPGSEWIFRGKVGYNSFTSEWTVESPSRVSQPCIIPVYSTTAGLQSSYIAKLIAIVINQYWGSKNTIKDFLPGEIITKYDLLPLQSAVIQIHTPQNFKQIEAARRRLAFDELFVVSLRARLSKEELRQENAPAIHINKKEIDSFINKLPFELTGDQRRAAEQILSDLRGDSPHAGTVPIKPMNRLLNGDVGSGKTVVAAIAAAAAVKAGYQIALMAPTEVLASQHFETFSGFFAKTGVSVGLTTSSIKKITEISSSAVPVSAGMADSGKETLAKPKPQDADIVIGTQALLQKNVSLANIGLIIVDEQHRFGVKQRAMLKEKTDGKIRPHFLSMTATPIPRTLHLALFGDLNVSMINEKPKNRKEIKTRFVEPENRMKAYDFIRSHVAAGRQIFVICPLIQEPEESADLFGLDKKSVTRESERLQKEIFPKFKVAMLHGKMKSREKERILSDFAAGNSDILVSTSVIEVGIDVPNATVMMIEDAERFGLAQLHQFRGRVGRAGHQSFCFLFSNSLSQNILIRLRSLESVSDGFKLAEIDLETRGPGDLFGTMQHGQLELKLATFSDRMLIEQASRAASEIIQKDPRLESFPIIREKLAEFEASKHFE